MKIIGIDVDGVTAQLDKVWLDRYNKDYDDDMKPEEWTDWDVHKIVKPECGEKIYSYIEDPTIYDDVIPYPGVLEQINLLKWYFRVIFITTSTLGAAGRKYIWLKDWKFLDKQDDYFEAKDKSLIYSDYLVDDSIKNIAAPTYWNRINILMTRPWNKKYDYEPRMENWYKPYNFK